MCIQITSSCARIERRTRLIVSEVFEFALGALALAEESGRKIAGKVGRNSRDRLLSAPANTIRAFRVGVIKLGKAFTEASRVQLIDREHADATSSASRTTGKKLSAAQRGVSEGRVKDLDKLPVANGARMEEGIQSSAVTRSYMSKKKLSLTGLVSDG
jgi:hypothetical protein